MLGSKEVGINRPLAKKNKTNIGSVMSKNRGKLPVVQSNTRASKNSASSKTPVQKTKNGLDLWAFYYYRTLLVLIRDDPGELVRLRGKTS